MLRDLKRHPWKMLWREEGPGTGPTGAGSNRHANARFRGDLGRFVVGGADRDATPRDAARPDVATPDGAGPEADAGVPDAMAPDALVPDVGRWPAESYCPPLDCADLPTWEGPEGLECAPPAAALECPAPTLVCPDDLSQLRLGPDGCVRFWDCQGAPHGPECEGQSECTSCLGWATGEPEYWEVDSHCCYDGLRLVEVRQVVDDRTTRVHYDARDQPTSWRSDWVGGHDRDWDGAGTCQYDPEGRVVAYHANEVETGGMDGSQQDGCATYNRAGQLTGKATFEAFADGAFVMAARRCAARPADDCQPHLWCERGEASPRFLDTCSYDFDR